MKTTQTTQTNELIKKRILTLIEESGKQDKEILDDTGLSHSSISTWRKGRANPSAEAISKIGKYFNVSADYLLYGDEIDKNFSSFGSDPEWRDIYNQVCTLSEKDRIKVTSFVQGYIEGIKQNEK